MSSIDVRRPVVVPAARLAILAAAGVVASALNFAVARGAVALGADSAFAPLTLPVFTAFTLIGVAAGFEGWRRVVRGAERPAAVLKVLVPAVVLVSFVPDVVLMATGFIPHSSTLGASALAAMHVVVAAVAVPVYRIICPVTGLR
ncbi:hypothetical protein ACIA49_40110 [Kribbella sp. NPDC051587]|uniref:hypothetical protein n=1 Tax=Kribbella sp. NPDC051587 TaxID=3364119 RepID=UPI0037BAAEDE